MVETTQTTEQGSPQMSKWEERHEGALAGSELGKCLHCAAARLVGLPKTQEYTPQQLRRMSIGHHFQALEREGLKEEGADWYAGRLVVLEGLAIPVRATPDFVIRENGGYRIREVKYRSSPPPELPREWLYQLGIYRLRYESCPGDVALYDFNDREVIEAGEIPPDLPVLLREWTEALAGVLDGRYQPHELPHEPYWCKRSEWACTDCIGQRTAETELSVIEEARFKEYEGLRLRFEALKQAEKEFDAAQDAAKEIIAAHGGLIVRGGLSFRLGETVSERLDTKAIPPEVKATLPVKEVVSRRIWVKEVEAL